MFQQALEANRNLLNSEIEYAKSPVRMAVQRRLGEVKAEAEEGIDRQWRDSRMESLTYSVGAAGIAIAISILLNAIVATVGNPGPVVPHYKLPQSVHSPVVSQAPSCCIPGKSPGEAGIANAVDAYLTAPR